MRAVVLGGTGLIGRAVARRLVAEGWDVGLASRGTENVPQDLVDSAARLVSLERSSHDDLRAALRDGGDLLVDCLCFTADDAWALLPFLDGFGSSVMISSKAVYVDAHGNHVNSPTAPLFTAPIREDNPTITPRNGDFNTAEGYGANKVAAELTLLDSGHPVTVLRASKVHGDGAKPPREWAFAQRALLGRRALFLRRSGESIDHTTAAANLAALVHRTSAAPGRRILNSADPDAPTVKQIAEVVAEYFDHAWDYIDVADDSPLGHTPWDTASPIILDTSAATELGYLPVGTYADTVTTELAWLAECAAMQPHDIVEAAFEERFIDLSAEDEALAASA